MRIVVISDTHGLHEQLPQICGDVLIHCGDLCDGFHPNDEDLERIDRWFGRLTFQHVLCVGGNHDFAIEDRIRKKVPVLSNATYLQDSGVEIKGIKFYGAPWVPLLDRWAFYATDDELRAKWSLVPEDTDVLITHTPPWHILDSTRDQVTHCGCSHLAARIASMNLKLHCFGHVHASYGRIESDGVTHLNASAVNSKLEIANLPFFVDLETDG